MYVISGPGCSLVILIEMCVDGEELTKEENLLGHSGSHEGSSLDLVCGPQDTSADPRSHGPSDSLARGGQGDQQPKIEFQHNCGAV